ncbi:MAG: hypothetical protein FGM32_07745 [Candidatus Kapabacteria bacterium]|nr:hypothetical protein [Candidatus Kapabacteria bacterium]
MRRNVANPLIRKPRSGYGVASKLVIYLLLAVTLLLSPSGLRAQQSKPPATESMITDWSVVGPFANVGGTGVVRRSPPELEPDTTTTFENMWGGTARWNRYHAADLLGWVNLTGHTPSKSCLFLARTAIYSSIEQRVHLRLGLIGAARLYLNDSLIAAMDDDVFARSSSITISCTLGQGWNTLRVRIGRDVMPLLSFAVAIEDTMGRPLTGVTISSAIHPKSSVNPAAMVVEKRRDEIDTVFQRNEEILKALRISAEQDTSSALWLTSRAQELLRSGNAESALRSAERALSLVQELAAAWSVKGLAHQKLGSKDSARMCIERALEIDPGLPEAWHSSFTVLDRPHPLQEITPVNLDSLATAAAREPVNDSLQSETIFTDVQQAILFGSTVAKKADLIVRIHAVDRRGTVPLPTRASNDPYTKQQLYVIRGDGSKRIIELNDTATSLSSVQRGDVLVYHVERLVRDSTFPLFANADMQISTTGPVRRARLSVIVPSTYYYQFSTQNFLPDYADRETPFGTVFTWESRDVPRLVPEPNMPPAEHFAPRIVFGTFRNWRTVSTYAEDLYKRRMQPCDELRSLVDRLLPSRTTWSKDVVVQTVTRWVIDSLELVNDPTSLFAPHRACDVLQRRTATAADKVVLTITMLAERGVEALPALINTNSGQGYNEPSPGLESFDHVIVVLPDEARAQMVDLTARTMPFGMAPRLIEDKYGMPLSERMRDPVVMHRRFINKRESHATSRVVFADPRSASEEITFTASDLDSAEIMRLLKSTTGGSSDGVPPAYDTGWVTPLKKSPLTPALTLRNRIGVISDPNGDSIFYRPEWVPMPSYAGSHHESDTRTYPLEIGAAYDSTTAEILIVPPQGYTIVKPRSPITITLPSMTYTYSALPAGRNLRLRRTIAVKKPYVEPAEYPQFREARRSMLVADNMPVLLVRSNRRSRK